MKRNYISPVSRVFHVATTEMIADSINTYTDGSANNATQQSDGTYGLSKEEKGSGIWDLYN